MNLTILAAAPDSGSVFALPRRDRSGLQIAVPGLLNWIDRMSDPAITNWLKTNWLWMGGKIQDYSSLTNLLADNVLVALVDADGSEESLLQAASLLETKPHANVFNHPAAVRNTRRDRVMSLLSSIDGVSAPTTIRITPRGARDIVEEAVRNELTWPVIVRSAGMHGGADMVLLDSADEIQKLDCFALNDNPYYLIQFADFRDSEGRYRKFRFVYVGDRIFLRHMITGDNWLIHSNSRLMTDQTIAHEREMLGNFESILSPATLTALEDIRRIVGLDFFGLDCAIDEKGTITPFEANAAMDIFTNTHPQYNLWDKTIKHSADALLELLRRPQKWRHTQTITS